MCKILKVQRITVLERAASQPDRAKYVCNQPPSRWHNSLLCISEFILLDRSACWWLWPSRWLLPSRRFPQSPVLWRNTGPITLPYIENKHKGSLLLNQNWLQTPESSTMLLATRPLHRAYCSGSSILPSGQAMEIILLCVASISLAICLCGGQMDVFVHRLYHGLYLGTHGSLHSPILGLDAWNVFVCIFEDFKNFKNGFDIFRFEDLL